VSALELWASPDGAFFLRWHAARRKFRATAWHAQLAKEHDDELAPTTETASMPFSLVLAYSRFKFQTRDQLQNL